MLKRVMGKASFVQLQDESTQLGEVVITGFQEVQRKLFTGSAANVKMTDARITGMTDATQMLEGRVAGVTVDNVSGTFGTSPKIRIRGNTSINGDNQPLFVVDGVILEDLNNVSADDIMTGNANTLTASSIAGPKAATSSAEARPRMTVWPSAANWATASGAADRSPSSRTAVTRRG